MMKSIISRIGLIMILLFITGCSEDDQIEITQNQNFELLSPKASNINLNFSKPDNPAFTLVWKDNLTSTSSYTVEMSKDNQFENAVILGNSGSDTFTMSVANFNQVLIGEGIDAYKPTPVYMRVIAGSEVSNIISFSVTSFPEDPPVINSPDDTFSVLLSDVDPEAVALTVMVGDPNFDEDTSNTTVDVTYFLEADIAGGDFADPIQLGSTDDGLEITISHSTLNEAALILGINPEEEGMIDIRIRASIEADGGNFERFSDPVTIKVTPYDTVLPPIIYVVGAAAVDAGWGWDSPVELMLNGNTYSGNITLSPAGDANFRFFTVKDDWGSGQNYPYYSVRGYTIDSNFENAQDDDQNFKFVGTEGTYNLKIDTANKTITLGDPVYGPSPVSWGIVGSGYNNWGDAGPDATFYTSDTPNVIVTYVNLIDGLIKFRENNDWGNNLGDNGADGTLEAGGADIAVTAGTYKVQVNLNDNTYTIEPYSWGIVGSGYNDWGNAGPDAKFYYDYTTDTFKVSTKLLSGEIKFRLNNDWGINYGDNGGDGTIEEGGANIVVSEGYYLITLDVKNGTYSITPTSAYGIVGSGYNNWGDDGPDFPLTEVQPNVYYGAVATLLDGEIKFRVNNDWGVNYGDDGANGTLEAGGANIVVTAGLYRIHMDLNNNTYQLYKIQ